VAARWLYLVGCLVTAIDVPGIRSIGVHVYLGHLAYESLQEFVFLSICAGTAWLEPDPIDSLDQRRVLVRANA
jgi:hypothetical protein